MNRSTKFVLAAVAALGLAAVAVPVIAQQTQMGHGAMSGEGMMQGSGHMGGGHMGGGHGKGHGAGKMGMQGDHDDMGQGMGGGMGMMRGASAAVIERFDTDKDGTLTAEEISAGVQGEIKAYDQDGNGTLSLDEFAAMHADHTRPQTVRVFQMHDPDGDAQVTEAEMIAMAEDMQSHMGQGAEGHGGKHRGMMGDN